MPIYKSNNGTYELSSSYVDTNGNKKRLRKRGFRTVKEAKEYERVFMLTSQEQGYKVVFEAVYLELLENKRTKLKETSVHSFISVCELHILPTFRSKYLQEITTRDIIRWQSKLAEKNFSQQYYSTIHEKLVNIFNFAIKSGYINNNPASIVGKIKKANEVKKEKNFYTLEEFEKFISVITDKEDLTLFTLLYTTGMRRGEMLALTWKDIDFEKNSITINKAMNKFRNVTPPKTQNSYRTNYISSRLKALLVDLKEDYRGYYGFNENWFVFGGIKHYAIKTLENRLNKYCKLADVKRITPHEFRHSLVSLLYNNGLPTKAIAEQIGDTEEMVINIYSHLFETTKEQVNMAIENI